MPAIAELVSQAVQLQLAGRLSEAAELYEQVVRADPRHAQAWHQLGLIAFHRNQHEAAFEYLRRAIVLDGAQPAFHHNMGACCRALGKLADAQASYDQTLRLDPNYYCARAHLALTLAARGRHDKARQWFEQVMAAQPNTVDDHCVRGTTLLAHGRFAEGWEEHEWRLRTPLLAEPRATSQTRWDRTPLAGRTILLYSEQGLGDTLQLVRYVQLVKEQGGVPILAVPKALIPLLAEQRLGEIVPRDEAWPPFDVQLGMFSLPWAFRTTLETIPRGVPYLNARPQLVDSWRARLHISKGLRVGISWQGNTVYSFDRSRSIPLAHFASLAELTGVQLFSLQKGPGSQIAQLQKPLEMIDFGSELDSEHGPFMDTAAIMKNLDLVITSDTVTAHLAGALGVPVWVLLSTMPDWRWMYDRQDSPWYPTMRLFRQAEFGDWDEVFARVKTELADLAARTVS